MAITYPLTPPTTPGRQAVKWYQKTAVGLSQSPFTGKQQVQRWAAQWWQCDVTLPPMAEATAAAWVAFLCALNGTEGTFYFGDQVRRNSLGTIAGSPTVGAGATANSTTLPISGGTGLFAVSDWLQVGTTAPYLHKVIQVNSGASVDVWPRLRAAYASGTAITYANPVGLFRLVSNSTEWDVGDAKAYGISFSCMEALS